MLPRQYNLKWDKIKKADNQSTANPILLRGGLAIKGHLYSQFLICLQKINFLACFGYPLIVTLNIA